MTKKNNKKVDKKPGKKVNPKVVFRVDAKKTEYVSLRKLVAPKVVLSSYAAKWIKILVDEHTTEVGFYGVVDMLDPKTYYVRDIFYPKHDEAHGATCQISQEGEDELMAWMITNGREDDIPKLMLWGHSHVNMGVSPSGQDQTQGKALMDSRASDLVRVIVNKSGDISVSVFCNEEQVVYNNVKIEQEIDTGFCDEKLTLIRNLVNNVADDSDSKDVIKEVSSIIGTDYEYGSIVEKVKVLKKENMPETKVTTYNYSNRYTNTYGGGRNSNVAGLNNNRYHDHYMDDVLQMSAFEENKININSICKCVIGDVIIQRLTDVIIVPTNKIALTNSKSRVDAILQNTLATKKEKQEIFEYLAYGDAIEL